MTTRARVAVIVIAVVLAATNAFAQPTTAQKAQARALFEQGRALMEMGRYTEACRVFEESDRLAPGAGTKFNLAACYERIERLASAWSLYLEVAERMRAAGQPQREAVARERGESLRGRLARLRIEVSEPVAGLQITRDGEPVSEAQWGIEVPIDPGIHRVTATAPGHRQWEQTLQVHGQGAVSTLLVPALERAPSSASARPADTTTAPGLGAQRVTGLVVGGLGLATLGVTLGLALHAKATDAQSEPFCDEQYCDPTGLELNDEAVAFANAATVTFMVGGLLVGAGVVLLLTAPADAQATRAELGLRPTGATVRVQW